MRLIVELQPAGGDRVDGAVTAEDGIREAFFGWLDLLRLLERALTDGVPAGHQVRRAPAPDAPQPGTVPE